MINGALQRDDRGHETERREQGRRADLRTQRAAAPTIAAGPSRHDAQNTRNST